MNITNYCLMQSLHITCPIPDQLEKLNKLPNYSMVNCDSLEEHMQQIDENYPFAVPTWLIILVTVLGTPVIATCFVAYCFCKYR